MAMLLNLNDLKLHEIIIFFHFFCCLLRTGLEGIQKDAANHELQNDAHYFAFGEKKWLSYSIKITLNASKIQFFHVLSFVSCDADF